MAKAKDGEVETTEPVKASREWINCKVNIPNCHVGMIECRISGSIPEAERYKAACLAAAAVRGIALNASGVPQFASAPIIEYLEN
jgi:hypothetical protein